jgi:hypothetical protein
MNWELEIAVRDTLHELPHGFRFLFCRAPHAKVMPQQEGAGFVLLDAGVQHIVAKPAVSVVLVLVEE